MNESQIAITNGKRLLKDLQKYADPRIKVLSSSALTVEKDMVSRYAKLKNFADKTDNYQIAKINDVLMGSKIISHYKKKFKQSQNSDATASALLMMIGNDIWIVDKTKTFTPEMESAVALMLGGDKLPPIGKLQAQLEVRIQPRGLSSPGKYVSIDVMSSFRLSGKLNGGLSL